jgi:hypothetical protein
MLRVQLFVVNSTIGGTADVQLFRKIPGGYTAGGAAVIAPIQVLNNVASTSQSWTPSGTDIAFRRDITAGVPWALSASGTWVGADMAIEVQ